MRRSAGGRRKLRTRPDLSGLKGREEQSLAIAWPKADLQEPPLFGLLIGFGQNPNQHRGQGLAHHHEVGFFMTAQGCELDGNKHRALVHRCSSEMTSACVSGASIRGGHHTGSSGLRIIQTGYGPSAEPKRLTSSAACRRARALSDRLCESCAAISEAPYAESPSVDHDTSVTLWSRDDRERRCDPTRRADPRRP